MIRVSIEYAYHRNTRIIRNNTRIVRIRVSYELQTDIRAVMFPGGTRGNAGERGGTPSPHLFYQGNAGAHIRGVWGGVTPPMFCEIYLKSRSRNLYGTKKVGPAKI